VRAQVPLSRASNAGEWTDADGRAALMALDSASGHLVGIVDNATVRRAIRCD
jgi:hypothetical protein